MLLITFLITLPYAIQTLVDYGKYAEVGDFKFKVAITDKGKYICGGVIMDLTYVLTAAHCITFEHLNDLRVIAGEVKEELFGNEIKNEVKEIRFHPRFRKESREFDLVMLILKKDIESKHPVAPINIINSDYIIVNGTITKLVAWDHFHGLRLASINSALWHPDNCTALNIYGTYDFHYPLTPLTSENTICINVPNDTCIYDDAGAVLVNDKLLGIISWNVHCNDTDKPLVLTNMAFFGLWIKRVKRDL